MSANVPFLAKFARRLSKEEAESNLGNTASEKGTIITKVNRETTDDR